MSYKSELRSNNNDLQSILKTIEELPEGTKLPVLSNPATADIIPSGYEAVDGDGNLIEGTGAGLGDAVASDVVSGKTFTSVNGLKIAGTGGGAKIIENNNIGFASMAFSIKGLTSIPQNFILSYCTNGVGYQKGTGKGGMGYGIVEFRNTNGVLSLYHATNGNYGGLAIPASNYNCILEDSTLKIKVKSTDEYYFNSCTKTYATFTYW